MPSLRVGSAPLLLGLLQETSNYNLSYASCPLKTNAKDSESRQRPQFDDGEFLKFRLDSLETPGSSPIDHRKVHSAYSNCLLLKSKLLLINRGANSCSFHRIFFAA